MPAPEWDAADRPSISPRAGRVAPTGGGSIAQEALRSVSNLPIKVPAVDWAPVSVGEKRMFRWYANGTAQLPAGETLPRPCLLYAARRVQAADERWVAMPGVLTACRTEPLGSIKAADVAAEGFEYLPAFRWYWKLRYKRLGWRPWDLVNVYEVRPLFEEDAEWAARWALDRLYGEWL